MTNGDARAASEPGSPARWALGKEVRDPARTISRAIQHAMAGAVAVYAVVAVTVLAVLGPDRVAASDEPLAAAVRVASWGSVAPVVARQGNLPRRLAAVLVLTLPIGSIDFGVAVLAAGIGYPARRHGLRRHGLRRRTRTPFARPPMRKSSHLGPSA